MALARANVCPRGKMNEVTCVLRHPKALHTVWMLEMGEGDCLRVLPGLRRKAVWALGRTHSSRLEKGYQKEDRQEQSGLNHGCPWKRPFGGCVPQRWKSGDHSNVEARHKTRMGALKHLR